MSVGFGERLFRRALLLIVHPADAKFEAQGLSVELDALHEIRERLSDLRTVDILVLDLRLRLLLRCLSHRTGASPILRPPRAMKTSCGAYPSPRR